MKLKLVFAGIDGSGKTTSMDRLIQRLAARHRVLRIGSYRPATLYDATGETPALARDFSERQEALGRAARRFHLYPLFLPANFAFKYLLARWVERAVPADVVVYETDTLLHPSVYAAYHFAWARRIAPRWRFRVARALFGSVRNLLVFYLDLDPETATQRILARGSEVMTHENPKDLAALHDEYDAVLAVAERAGVDIVRLDTLQSDPDRILEAMERAVAERLP